MTFNITSCSIASGDEFQNLVEPSKRLHDKRRKSAPARNYAVSEGAISKVIRFAWSGGGRAR
jgi:hypothetical protein